MYFLMICSPVSLRELAVRGSSGHAAGERPEDQSQHLHAAVPAGGKKLFFSVPPLRSDAAMRLTSYWRQRESLTYTPCSAPRCNQGKLKNRVTSRVAFPLKAPQGANLASFMVSDADCLQSVGRPSILCFLCASFHSESLYKSTQFWQPGSL